MTPSDLLDLPPLDPQDLTALEEAVAGLLVPPGTRRDVVLVPGEAILALEATARSVAHPGSTAINVVTGPYGALFGGWMRTAGAHVIDVVSELDDVARPDAVAAALDDRPEASVLAVVHAEAATGGTNPLDEIATLARERGVLLVVDAVASVGAEPVPVGRADVVAIGPQKGLAGPAGISALTVSPRAWEHMAANPGAPRDSSLSLLDHRERWLLTDRSAYPGYLPWLEARAFAQALHRVTSQGIAAVEEGHRRAAAATRAGIEVLGLAPWQRRAEAAAPIVTTVRLPDGVDGVASPSGLVGAGPGPLAGRLVRVLHTGRDATLDAVRTALTELAAVAPRPDSLGEALVAAEGAHAG